MTLPLFSCPWHAQEDEAIPRPEISESSGIMGTMPPRRYLPRSTACCHVALRLGVVHFSKTRAR